MCCAGNMACTAAGAPAHLQPGPVLILRSPGLPREHEGTGGSCGGYQGTQLSADRGAGCSQPKGTPVCCGVPWLAKHWAPRGGWGCTAAGSTCRAEEEDGGLAQLLVHLVGHRGLSLRQGGEDVSVGLAHAGVDVVKEQREGLAPHGSHLRTRAQAARVPRQQRERRQQAPDELLLPGHHKDSRGLGCPDGRGGQSSPCRVPHACPADAAHKVQLLHGRTPAPRSQQPTSLQALRAATFAVGQKPFQSRLCAAVAQSRSHRATAGQPHLLPATSAPLCAAPTLLPAAREAPWQDQRLAEPREEPHCMAGQVLPVPGLAGGSQRGGQAWCRTGKLLPGLCRKEEEQPPTEQTHRAGGSVPSLGTRGLAPACIGLWCCPASSGAWSVPLLLAVRHPWSPWVSVTMTGTAHLPPGTPQS